MASGAWIAAMMRMWPRHRGHSKTSTEKILFVNSAHL
jgi:hypothetical protein